MARWMSEDGGYRAVVKVKTKRRNPNTHQIEDAVGIDYIGPYDRPGQAKAAVTTERRQRKTMFIDGWIERARWERVD